MADNLGALATAFVEIIVDFSKVESQLQSGLKPAIDRAAQSFSGIGATAEQSASRAASSFDGLRNSMAGVSTAAVGAASSLRLITDGSQQAGNAMLQLRSNAEQGLVRIGDGAAQGVISLRQLSDGTYAAGSSWADMGARVRQAFTEFNSGRQQALQALAPFTQFGEAIEAIGGKMRILGIGLSATLTAPIVAVTGLGLSFNAMQEQAQIGFTTMLGSGERARSFLGELKEFAAKTPFQFPDLVTAAQRMLAYGFAAKDILPTLRTIGDASSLLGGGAEAINRITLALGQIKAKGTVQAEEMRQLAEAGIPAWQILATKLSVDIPTAMKMVEARAVSADVAIRALTEGMNERFGGGMEKAARSWSGLLSTIADESRFIAGELTEGFFSALKGPLASLADGMGVFRKQLDLVPDSIKAIGLAGALMVAAVGPALFIGGTLAGGISNLINLSVQLRAAWIGMTAAGSIFEGVSLGAIGAAAGVATLGAALGVLVGHVINLGIAWSGAQSSFDKMLAGVVNGIPIIGKWITGTSMVDAANSDEKAGIARMKDALRQRGLNADQGSLSDDEFIARSAALMRTIPEFQDAQANQAFFQGLPGQKPGTVSGLLGEIYKPDAPKGKATSTAVDQAKREADQMYESFDRAIRPASELEKTLSVLHQRHVEDADILKVYGDRIVRAADEQLKFGGTLPPVTKALYDQMVAARDHSYAVEGMADALERAGNADFGLGKAISPQSSLGKILAPEPEIDVAEPEIEERQRRFVREGRNYANEFRRDWASAFGNVTRDFSSGLNDMMFHSRSFGDVLKGTFSHLAESITEAFTTKLFSPVEQRLEKLADRAANWALDHVPGLGGTAANAATNAGADAAASAATSAAGVGGSAASSAGAGGAGSSMMSGVVGGAVSGVISGAITYAGIMRLEGTMNAVEANTRFSYLEIRDLMDGHLNWIVGYQKIMTEQLGDNGVNGWLRDISAKMGPGSGAPSVSVQQTIGDITVTGGGDDEHIRGVIMQALETGRDNLLEAIVTAVKNNWAGAVSAASPA